MHEEKRGVTNILAAMAIGAGCMYLLDPSYGKRRRALVRDKIVRLSHKVEDETGVIARDLTNRTWGIAASVGRAFRHADTDETVLVPRIRSEMGRWVSHPHAIYVEVRDGRVILSGDILKPEEKNLIQHVGQVSGVREVENRLRVHENAENLRVLQGGSRRESKFELLQTNWAPGPRLLVGAAGAALVGHGIRSRGLIGTGVSIIGSILLFRAVTNIEFKRLFGGKESDEKASQNRQGESGVSIPINRPEPPEYRIH